MENAVTLINNFHGDVEWVCRGAFSFKATRRRMGTTTYTCGTAGCKVRFLARAGVVGRVQGGVHDHEPELWIPQRNAMYQTLKARSTNEWTRLYTIYLEEAARHPDAAPHLLFYNVVSSMRHWRRQAQPPVPSTLDGYVEALQGHADFHELYLGTVRAGGASAVILGQPGFVALLRAAKTDLRTPLLRRCWLQMLTVHVTCEPQFYHPIVALMSYRRRDLYEAIFRHLWELAENPRPDHIVSDYEVALQEALRQVTERPVVGCYFHYMQVTT